MVTPGSAGGLNYLRPLLRQPCFLQEQDYRFYLEALREAAQQAGCRVHAYVLMTNHVHLLVTPVRVPALSDQCSSGS